MSSYTEALERQLETVDGMRMFVQAYHSGELPPDFQDSRVEPTVNTMRNQIGLISRATPMYWVPRTADIAVQAGAKLDLTDLRATRELLPFDVAWCYFEQPFMTIQCEDMGEPLEESLRQKLPGLPKFGEAQPVKALSWAWVKFQESPTLESLLVTAFCQIGMGGTLLSPSIWCYVDAGERMAEVGATELNSLAAKSPTFKAETQQVIRFVSAAGLFLRQRVLSTEGRQVERHARKRIAKSHPDVRPVVEVVHLRARDTAPRDPNAREGEPVEWSCQWLVSGHWRKQYYPSLGSNLPIWIDPYVKGPEDMPLRPRRATLYAVSR